MYAVFSRLRLYSSKGRRKDASSVAITDLENELLKQVEATGRENTPPGHGLIVKMKRGKHNLEILYF